MRVTLISPASTSGKQDIELQSGTRTWAVFGCSSVLSSSFYLHRVRSSRRSLARFTKRMHDATSYQIFLSPFSFYRPLSISLFLSFTTKLVVRPSTLDISDSKHNFSPGGLYACRGILPWWRRVAASLKFHTRWPTYQTLPQTCLASSPAVKHPENFLPEESSHYTSSPLIPSANVPFDNFGKPFTGKLLYPLLVYVDWILDDLHEFSHKKDILRFTR